MNGHLIDNIHSMSWTDSELIALKIDYDSIRIFVSRPESNATMQVVNCEGYIGYKTIGVWDEMIINSIKLEKGHPFIKECWEGIWSKYKGNPPITGNPARNAREWQLLKITLIDNVELLIVCGEVSVYDEAMTS